MDGNNIDTYFEILEISPDASIKEIRTAYLYLKKLYSEGSIATQPVSDELYELDNSSILEEIETAYNKITSCLQADASEAGVDKNAVEDIKTEESKSDPPCFSGNILKKIRNSMGVELCEIASHTKIGRQHLNNIENEKFEQLPAEVFLKGYLRTFAEHLSLDSEKVVNDYMTKYHLWRENKSRQGQVYQRHKVTSLY
jgi:flagellar biosynthesis protein FlhG